MTKAILLTLNIAAAAVFAGTPATPAANPPEQTACAAKAVRLAEDYDPNRNCSCKKWAVVRDWVCVETDANGNCKRKELQEISRTCVDWACHDKA